MKTQTRPNVKMFMIFIWGIMMGLQTLYAQQKPEESKLEESLIALSKMKWKWMAEKDVASLDDLFHANAVFVHMGGTMNKEQEIGVIKSGRIEYKHAEIEETTVRFVDQTAIVLDKIRLTAIVGGKEVVNPFMVTEVYVFTDNRWKLASLSFTRLLGD
ncbi:nuclear transport factor 2 family protein [Tannerella forsythia]|nr:nuclear transport factor 2 family protein [Tannerella forsythia]